MEYAKHLNGTTCEMILKGKFTFSDHLIFRELFNAFPTKQIHSLIVDFTGVDFIDSAALGILLLTRDEASKENISLNLRNPSGQVKKMFEVARFYDLFNVV